MRGAYVFDMRKNINVKVYLVGLYVLVLMICLMMSSSSKLSFESIAINFALFLIAGIIFWFAVKHFGYVNSISENLRKASKKIEDDAKENANLWEKYSLMKGSMLFSDKRLEKQYDEFLRENNRLNSLTGGNYQCGIADYINRDLIDSTLKKNLFNIVPSVMTGLGILGTFIGLSIGLREFSTGNATEISDSIAPLMDGIKVAFHTSIYGMIFSLAFNYIYKQFLENAYADLNDFLKKYDEYVLGNPDYANAVKLRSMLMDMPREMGREMFSILKPAFEELNANLKALPDRIGEQVSKTIKPEFAEVNKNLLSFSENVSENNLEGLSQIIDSFMKEMNRSLGDSFTKLSDTINTVCDMQKQNSDYLEDVISRTGATSVNVDNINKMSEKTIKKMNAYVDNIDKLQKAINASYDSVNARMEAQDEINLRIKEYIESLKEQQERLTDITTKVTEDINCTAREFSEVSKQFNTQLTGSLDKTFECFDSNLGAITRQLSNTISEVDATTERVPNVVLAAYDGMEKTFLEMNDKMKEILVSLEKMQESIEKQSKRASRSNYATV